MAMGSDHRPDTKATPHVPHGWHGLYLEVVPLAPKSPSLGEAGCRWTLCIRYTQRPDSAACFCPTVNPSDIEVLRSAYSYICECDQGRLDDDQPQSGRLFFYVPRLLVVQNSSRPLSLQPFQLRVDSERVRVSGGGGIKALSFFSLLLLGLAQCRHMFPRLFASERVACVGIDQFGRSFKGNCGSASVSSCRINSTCIRSAGFPAAKGD